MTKSFIAIDAFSGCGGMTLGLKQAGFKVIGAVEIDRLAVQTYKVNHPHTHVWETDIRDLSINDVHSTLNLTKGELDLLAGCPPCQGFSSIRTLNKTASVDDDRNDLVFQFVRLVEGLLPKTIMMENVPGLANDSRMELVLKRLEKLGYKAQVRILDAADFGVPQRRKRMIMLAGLNSNITFAEPCKNRILVMDVISNLDPPGKSGDPLHDLPERRSKRIMELIKLIPKDGGSRSALGEENQLPCHKRAHGFNDVYGRMRWRDVSPTITGGCTNPSKGRFLHPEENRAITLREAALLQSFPENYYFSLEKGKQGAATMIGNALPPAFVRHHAKEIFQYLKGLVG